MPGRTLFVYSYLWFWENTFGNPTHDCPHCVLWTSALHPEWPTAAYGGFRRVTLHQYATSPVDRDRFQGSWGDLAELFSTPAPAPAPKPVPKGNTPLLHSGMVGQKVADIQHALDLLHNTTAHTDGMGHFGRETLRVLELFQKNRHLKVTGTTTPETWKLLRLVAHPKGH
jgi:peptidoglycan hydrolase-like protein with peptidoglycan-binding domain